MTHHTLRRLLVLFVAMLFAAACGAGTGFVVAGGSSDTADSARPTTSPAPQVARTPDVVDAEARRPVRPDRGTRTAAEPEPAVSETRAAEGDEATSSSSRPTLARGDEGPAVADLQRRLEDLGFWLGPADGTYGHLTRQAVLAFQGWEGLTRDGVTGPTTWSALDDASRPVPARDGNLIEIHEDAGVLLVVRDGRTRWALHTSTGTDERYTQPDGDVAVAETPDGTWTISWAVDGWRESDLGRLWRPRYFHEDGIAIHGYPLVPAYPASHGCARVSIPAMNFIWEQDLAPQGSTVVVR